MKLCIKELRNDKGWTVRKLSCEADVPVDIIYKYERGDLKNPGAGLLRKLATALGVTIDDLIVEEEVND